jgi:hypothetical protein
MASILGICAESLLIPAVSAGNIAEEFGRFNDTIRYNQPAEVMRFR